MPALSTALESLFTFIKNEDSGFIKKIATSAGLQVGLTSSPAELHVTGRLSVCSENFTLKAGSSQSLSENTTLVNVTTTDNFGFVTVVLPQAPRTGQIVKIKDYSGNSGKSSIVISAGEKYLIDGESTKKLNNPFATASLAWQGSSWTVIGGESRSVLLFGASTMSSTTAGTYWLLPGGPSRSATTFSISPGSPALMASPISGKIRNFCVAQNGAGTLSSGSGNMVYAVYVNGVATSLQVTIDITNVQILSDTDNSHAVNINAGDMISVSAVQPVNVTNSADNIVVTLEICSF